MFQEIEDVNTTIDLKTQNQSLIEIINKLFFYILSNYISAEDHNKIIRNVVINTNNVTELIKRDFYAYNITIITIINEIFKNANKIKMIVLYIRNLFEYILNKMNLIANNDKELTLKEDDELLINDENVK